MQVKEFRQGAVGALLNEYERAVMDLVDVISDLSDQDLIKILDAKTADPSFRSIQTILSHVIKAGYAYAIDIRQSLGEEISYPSYVLHSSNLAYRDELRNLFDFTVDTFRDIRDDMLEELDNSKKIRTPWGQVYDIEQLTEHAIVHILRHHRQIQKFKLQLASVKSL